MIDVQALWDGPLKDAGCLLPLSEKAQRAFERILERVPEAGEALSERAAQDIQALLMRRLSQLFLGPVLTLLMEFMGRGEYTRHVVLADSVSPELIAHVESFSKQAESLWGCSFEHSSASSLYERFPLAGELEGRITEDFVASQTEFLLRYLEYRDSLTTRFFDGRDAGRILSYRNTQASPRLHGRIVIGVQCEGGTFYYKPHDCGVDAFYRELVERAFSDVTAAPDVIQGDGFGFCSELVVHALEREEDVADYFHHFGVLAALFHALNGTDLHGENVLACGVRPSAIDLETLLAPPIRDLHYPALTPAERMWEASVLSKGILPKRNYVERTMTSALYRMDGVRNSNLPEFGDETLDAQGREACFLEGFRDGYQRVLLLRPHILDLLETRPGMTVRSLYSSSKVHSMLLNQLFWPECLASPERQEQTLSRLRIGLEDKEEAHRERVFSYEKACLRRGVIPSYRAGIFSRDLCGEDAREVIAKSAFSLSPYEAVREKLMSLSDAEREMEEKLICLSLEHRLCDDDREYPMALREPPVPAPREVLWAELRELLERVLDETIEVPDGTMCWYSPQLAYTGWRHDCGLCTLQADMMALSGAILGCPSGEGLSARATALMDRCIRGVADKLVRWQQNETCPTLLPGMRSGMAGLVRGCACAEEAGSVRAAALLDDLVSFLHDRKPCDEEKPGLADGIAGLLLYLCRLPERSDCRVEQKRLHEIVRLADHLAERLSDADFANTLKRNHDPFLGMAGIGAALASAQRTLGSSKYEVRIQEAFSAVCAGWDEKHGGWHANDGFLSTVKGEYAAGIGLCAMCAREGADDASGDIERCLELALCAEMREGMLFRQDILENGNALRVLFLNRADRLFPDRGFRERAEGILAQMVARKDRVGNYVVSPSGLRNGFDPSLALGTTGIALALAVCLARRSSAIQRP